MDVMPPITGWPLLELEALGQPLDYRPAAAAVATVVPRLYFRESFPQPSGDYPRVHAPPELTLKGLEDVTIGPNRVILSKNPPGLLGASFGRVGRGTHGAFSRSRGIYRPRRSQDVASVEMWDEPVYWADTSYPAIYGHLLLEVLPQLWGYREAGVRTVATSVPRNRTLLTLLGALGIEPDDVRTITGYVDAAQVLVATPPLMLRDYVHPEAREIFARLGRLARRSDAPTPERLYVSRSRARRRILRNEAEIEAMFEAAGFAVYHPQEHPIEDQIRTFSKARLIAGPGGSSLHTAVFAEALEKLLILCSSDWFTIADLLLHQEEGRVAMLFGTVAAGQEERDRFARDWTIDAHQARLTKLFHMGV
jgi:hypothetical protein